MLPHNTRKSPNSHFRVTTSLIHRQEEGRKTRLQQIEEERWVDARRERGELRHGGRTGQAEEKAQETYKEVKTKEQQEERE